jgi:hypothetical protein
MEGADESVQGDLSRVTPAPVKSEVATSMGIHSRRAPGPVPEFTTTIIDAESLSNPSQNDAVLFKAVMEIHTWRIRTLAASNQSLFGVVHSFEVGDKRVQLGSPLILGGFGVNPAYDAIPVYITGQDNQTRMVFAYRSKSQYCWRRFAGHIHNIFWKGDSEHMQNFDWRIQKEIDRVWDKIKPSCLHDDEGKKLSLEDLCITKSQSKPVPQMAAATIATKTERIIQESMSIDASEFNQLKDGVKPTVLLDYWWAGTPEDTYGRHINLVVASDRYIYCLAVTDDGMFPKYVQDRGNQEIGVIGSPAKGIPISKEHSWVLTPILEYEQQTDGVANGALQNVHVRGTVMGVERVRVYGIHTNVTSPFYEVNNAMGPMFRCLRNGDHEALESELANIIRNGGALPSASDDVQTKRSNLPVGRELVDERLHQLITAYHEFESGKLDPSAWFGKRRMKELMITEREIAIFKRYQKYVETWKTAYHGDFPLFAMQTLTTKLGFVARQWVADRIAENRDE